MALYRSSGLSLWFAFRQDAMRQTGAIVALFCTLAAAVSVPAAAQEKPLAVVEFFTSQGCNSCPPADAYFNELTRQSDLIALAYHVDYWDYLGWRDTLARPQNTERQYGYMRALGARDVYTPQMIVNGHQKVKGADRATLRQDLTRQAASGEGMTVPINASEDEDSVTIDVGAGAPDGAHQEANVVLVYFDGPKSIAIDRGENTGRNATYLNAVTDIRVAGIWHGAPHRYELPKSEFAGKGGCVALLQRVGKDGAPGPILGATVIQRP